MINIFFILQCNAIYYLSVIYCYESISIRNLLFLLSYHKQTYICRFYPTSRAKLIAVIKSEPHKKDLVKLRRAAIGEKPRASIKSLVQYFTGHDERKFSMTTINDRQLLHQKIRQKISVIKTNSFDWEFLTFDDIKKIVHFGILIHVLS